MRTLFETSWVRDAWSPNLGQAGGGTGNVFGDIATAAGTAAKSYFDAQKAEDDAKAKAAQAAAAAAAQARMAIAPGSTNTILGMSPTTAAIVGLAGVAAIVGVVLLSKK